MSDVTPTIFQDEVMDAFATYWAGRTQIQSPNDNFNRAKVPEADPGFIQWFILGDPGGQERWSSSVARNHFSRLGKITFTANTPIRVGLDPAYTMLDAVGFWLEASVLDHAIFSGVGTPLPLGDDGAWTQVSLSANWLYFTDRPSAVA